MTGGHGGRDETTRIFICARPENRSGRSSCQTDDEFSLLAPLRIAIVQSAGVADHDDLGSFDVSGLTTDRQSLRIVADGYLTYHQQVNLGGSYGLADKGSCPIGVTRETFRSRDE